VFLISLYICSLQIHLSPFTMIDKIISDHKCHCDGVLSERSITKNNKQHIITKTSLSTFLGLYQSELSTRYSIYRRHLNITVYYTHMPISLCVFHSSFLSVKNMYAWVTVKGSKLHTYVFLLKPFTVPRCRRASLGCDAGWILLYSFGNLLGNLLLKYVSLASCSRLYYSVLFIISNVLEMKTPTCWL